MLKSISILFIISLIFGSCTKTVYTLNPIEAPANLVTTVKILDSLNTQDPTGDGTGRVSFTLSADKAITYKIDFGDGNTAIVPSGVVVYKYSNVGTFSYTVVLSAIGSGGLIASESQTIRVKRVFAIPSFIVNYLTGNSTKTWKTANLVPGHVGVGPVTGFSPSWYAASPNQRSECLYNDRISFTLKNDGTISMSVNSNSGTYIIKAAISFYNFTGGDMDGGCFDLPFPASLDLKFSDATSVSTPDISTRIQFFVPSPGVVNLGTGGNTYEILSITETELHLRNIGIDGNAWYQILTPIN